MIDSLSSCQSFIFSLMLVAGNNPWPASFIAWPPLYFPNQPVKAQTLGSDYINYYGQCQQGGRGSSQRINLIECDICIWRIEGGWEGFTHSLLCKTCLIAPDNAQDWTERSLDPKGPWRHKKAYSSNCLPSPSPTPTLQNFVSCFMWLFPFNSTLSGFTLHFYRVLLQEIAMWILVLQLL